MDYLKQANGKIWLTEKNERVPLRCPKCGEDMGLFLEGEPVFLCKGEGKHYFGTLKFTGDEPILTIQRRARG